MDPIHLDNAMEALVTAGVFLRTERRFSEPDEEQPKNLSAAKRFLNV